MIFDHYLNVEFEDCYRLLRIKDDIIASSIKKNLLKSNLVKSITSFVSDDSCYKANLIQIETKNKTDCFYFVNALLNNSQMMDLYSHKVPKGELNHDK